MPVIICKNHKDLVILYNLIFCDSMTVIFELNPVCAYNGYSFFLYWNCYYFGHANEMLSGRGYVQSVGFCMMHAIYI